MSSPEGSLTLTLSAPANSHQTIMLRVNDTRATVHVEGAPMPRKLTVAPDANGFRRRQGFLEKTVKFTW